MKNFSLFFCSFCFFLNLSAQKKVSTYELVNIAGKQRMLSQKIAKTMAMKYHRSFNDAVQMELDQARVNFEKNMKTIFFNIKKDKKLVKIFNKAKKNYVSMITVMPELRSQNINKFISFMRATDLVLKYSDELVSAIEINSGIVSNRDIKTLINTSGKQRMYMQRFCYLVMLEKIKFMFPQDEQYATKINALWTDIRSSLNSISSSELNNFQTKNQLVRIRVMFRDVLKRKESILNGDVTVGYLHKMTNRMTSEYDKLTQLYTQI